MLLLYQWFSKQILTNNGKEFAKKKMLETFCEENGIEVAHGSPQTPTIQGLVERSNRSWKEDMRAPLPQVFKNGVKKHQKQLKLETLPTTDQ